MRRPALFAVCVGGSIAATLDILYATTFWFFYRHVAPMRVTQTIAGGVLGVPAAYEGGAPTALLGLGLHYFIAFNMAAAFYIASRRCAFLTRRAIVAGILYGIVLYLMMNFVVVPLSALPAHTWSLSLSAVTDLCSHMFFVGVPIALATRHARR